MIQAVLWDNDGVLMDSESMFFEVTRAAFAECGTVLTPAAWAREYLTEGRRTREMALALGMRPETADAMIARRNTAFRQKLGERSLVRAGIREVIHHLHGRVRMAVVTSAPRSQFDSLHRASGLESYFEFVITSDDCARDKPFPDAYLLALERLRLKPRECLAVEDSPRGLKAAVSAGIPCVVCPTPLTDLEACRGALRIVTDLAELPDVIQSLGDEIL